MVVHRIIEITRGHTISEGAFQKIWNRCVLDQEEQMGKSWFERHLIPLSVTARDFHLKRSQCFLLLHASEHVTQSKRPDDFESLHEQWLRSKDGLVIGRADEIRFEKGNTTIIDYKTGNVSGQSIGTEVLSEYEEQLKLYAALFHEEYGEWPYNLVVISLDGKSYYIDYTEKECLILLEESKNMLQRVNSRIKADEPSSKRALLKLASPSRNNCQYCLYRPACKPYFLTRKDDLTEGWPNDAWGIVEDKKILRNGLGKIILTPLSGRCPINIRGLRLERHAALDAFQKIGVFSLYSDNSNNNYKEGQFTTIYGIG